MESIKAKPKKASLINTQRTDQSQEESKDEVKFNAAQIDVTDVDNQAKPTTEDEEDDDEQEDKDFLFVDVFPQKVLPMPPIEYNQAGGDMCLYSFLPNYPDY